MTALRLIKKQWGRRRFAKKELQSDLLLWEEEALALKEQLLTSTNLQIIGPKTILEFSKEKTFLMIEVVGLPTKDLELVDFQEQTVLVYRCQESVFEADFLGLLARAGEIQQKIPHPMEDFFHLVLDNYKIELHFFMQKDYIQASTLKGEAT